VGRLCRSGSLKTVAKDCGGSIVRFSRECMRPDVTKEALNQQRITYFLQWKRNENQLGPELFVLL
jgi:hypothetical protein